MVFTEESHVVYMDNKLGVLSLVVHLYLLGSLNRYGIVIFFSRA